MPEPGRSRLRARVQDPVFWTDVTQLAKTVSDLVVWPPLRRRTAIAAMDALDDRIGQLLVDLGDGLAAGVTPEDVDTWVDRTRVEVLRVGGAAIVAADRKAILATRGRLDELVDLLGAESPAPSLWPVYGGLIINLRNIFDAMDEVAAANPMSQPPLPFRRARATP